MSTPPNRPATILVVDDEPNNIAVLVSLLRSDYRVRAATDGTGALRVARSEPTPDLILLDVMMPDLDGYAVLASLQQDPKTRHIPVIFVSALGESEDEERGLKLGAVDYVTKPIRPAVMLARVRTQLELKATRDRLSVHNATLEDLVQVRTQENALIQDVSLSVIAGLVETRDAETGLHTMRTQAYVDALARRLGGLARFSPHLAPSQIARLVKAAPLHDIGKIGIPDGILLKPGPLTADEFTTMKSHARIGGEAIAHAMSRAQSTSEIESPQPDALVFLDTARQIALWHHEKWNGTGYPDGLAGDSIPLCARLMAVADVFDALTTKRVYKPTMPIEQAERLIVEGKGAHFDPDLVDAFLAAGDDFRAIAARYADGSA